MFDYRNNLKRILQQTTADDRSLQNSLAAIKLVLGMADDGDKPAQKSTSVASAKTLPAVSTNFANLLTGLTSLLDQPNC